MLRFFCWVYKLKETKGPNPNHQITHSSIIPNSIVQTRISPSFFSFSSINQNFSLSRTKSFTQKVILFLKIRTLHSLRRGKGCIQDSLNFKIFHNKNNEKGIKQTAEGVVGYLKSRAKLQWVDENDEFRRVSDPQIQSACLRSQQFESQFKLSHLSIIKEA